MNQNAFLSRAASFVAVATLLMALADRGVPAEATATIILGALAVERGLRVREWGL